MSRSTLPCKGEWQAGVSEIRHALERRLPRREFERLKIRYEREGRLPAAAIVHVDGYELRLERDYLDGLWTLATNDRTPRLLDRLQDYQVGPGMVPVLEHSIEQLREG